MIKLIPTLAVGGVLAAVMAGGVSLVDGGYDVDLVMPTASNVVLGSPVFVDGTQAGTVSDIEARDGQAVLTLDLSDSEPLPSGSTARIAWKAVLGERVVEIDPGEGSSVEIPDGGLIEGKVHRVELDEVLAALDPPTRRRLSELVGRLDRTVGGSEEDLAATVRSAGPAVRTLGEVLEAVGRDGEAIRALVTRLDDMTRTLATRQGEIAAVIEGLGRVTDRTQARHQQLRDALRQLPGTLQAANSTLGRVPGVVQATTPLLEDLRPATEKLPGVAADLRPLLRDLRPAVADLRPTLRDARSLLAETPAFLDGAHAVLPSTTSTIRDTRVAAAFLRPYTPELAGWISNWASANANYDSYAHYARIWVQGGPSQFNQNPGAMPPGLSKNLAPVPGELEGQPWTDAHGSEMR